MNPEFLRQGSAFHDTIHTDRIIIGAHDKKAGDTLENLYRCFYAEKLPPTLRTTLATAELIKYASNALLATKISFINMIANICEKIPGADVTVVAKGMGMDKRISSLFLEAGLGYGGSCFPKDTKALLAHSRKLGYDPLLLDATEKINQNQPLKAVELCKKLLGGLKDKQIAILGLSFKPDTDDMREARVIPIIKRLIEENAKIVAYDPVAMPAAKKIFQEEITYAASVFDCLKNSDACILVTEWEEFRKLIPSDFVEHMKHASLVDGRRIYDVEDFEAKMRFAAIGLGRD